MRGKVVHVTDAVRNGGITPAYAGKSSDTMCPPHCHGDHPRVCGEKTALTKNFSLYEGSPPRMRGKVVAGLVALAKAGITPAYAGKSPEDGKTRF